MSRQPPLWLFAIAAAIVGIVAMGSAALQWRAIAGLAAADMRQPLHPAAASALINLKPGNQKLRNFLGLRRAVFCYNTHVPSMAELWRNGEKSNAPRIDLASTLTSRSREILQHFIMWTACE
jgi:hypothetical protein